MSNLVEQKDSWVVQDGSSPGRDRNEVGVSLRLLVPKRVIDRPS